MPGKVRKCFCVVVFLLFVLIFSVNSDIVEAQDVLTSEEVVLQRIPLLSDIKFEGITIKIFVNKDGIVYGYEVSGHSGYAEKGKDIVCAAVSTISQNTVISIKKYTADRVELKISDGYLKCLLPEMKDGIGSREASVLIKSALMGFYVIQESSFGSNYGSDYVRVFKVID